jgi:hypothetical protein
VKDKKRKKPTREGNKEERIKRREKEEWRWRECDKNML